VKTTRNRLSACSIVALLFTLVPPRFAEAARTVVVRADASFATLREKLADDPDIAEIVLEGGTYTGGLYVEGPAGTDFAKHPLLIRAADGAEVIFDGSNPVEKHQPHEKLPGVFWIGYDGRDSESPKLWEPHMRVRYRLVADALSVARFPATYTVEPGRLLFHTSDGQPPSPGGLLMSSADCGVFINRPHVTVRGIAFRNYLAREKWSTGADLRVDHITVEDCTSTNCSLGFIITGNNNVLRRCTAEDVGGGVYVGGADATVEACRLFKQRDGFMVPMYAQDDTGIQFYAPARGGAIRGNLCVGFGMGVFLKASAAPYLVQHNTLVGLGQGLGFGATNWHPGQRFHHNIVADCQRQVEIHTQEVRPGDVNHNCYWSPSSDGVKPIGDKDLVADPKFVWPQWRDFRLANDSPCLKLADAAGPCGAFPAVGDAPLHLGEPREWHVSESGRDGRSGSPDQPLRTIQLAVDRARPGDTIVVHPGLYSDPVRISRGGTKERPMTIRATEPGKAILDSNRAADVMISIDNAPHVQIKGLEIRWYGRVGIGIEQSPNVTVEGCRIWNAHWHGAWPTGTAVRAVRSPGFVGRENVLFRQENGFWFYHSPRFKLEHNTCAANLYSAAAVLYSCENSVCRNNSFAFQGNDVIVIEEELGQKDKLKTFECDYNNYGTALRRQPAGTAFDSVAPRERDSHLAGGSKAIVNYTEYRGQMRRFVSMADWRSFSGLDRHTIIADPLYADTKSRDFRLDPRSPNNSAGAAGATIGASAAR
jgi:hypothetical protein